MQQEILDDFYAYGKGPLASLERFHDITDPEMHTERQHEIYDWLQTNNPRTAQQTMMMTPLLLGLLWMTRN